MSDEICNQENICLVSIPQTQDAIHYKKERERNTHTYTQRENEEYIWSQNKLNFTSIFKCVLNLYFTYY